MSAHHIPVDREKVMEDTVTKRKGTSIKIGCAGVSEASTGAQALTSSHAWILFASDSASAAPRGVLSGLTQSLIPEGSEPLVITCLLDGMARARDKLRETDGTDRH